MTTISANTKIVSVAQMQQLEKESDAQGHSYAAMMEEAGAAVARAIQQELLYGGDEPVLVLAGPGHNGGDGLVCARHLHDAGVPVRLYLWQRSTAPEEDDENHFAQLAQRDVPSAHADDDPDFAQLSAWLEEAAVVVDALLGTGTNRPITGQLAALLDRADAVRTRRLDSPDGGELAVVAVDVPSGLHADDGSLDPHTLPADLTVTFAHAKTGHFQFPGAAHTGQLFVVDIGIPPELSADIHTFFLTPQYVAERLPQRSSNSHKGSFGKALAVVGSVNYPGAAFLSCAAMGRAGAGLVTGAVPQPVWVPVATALAEATWLLLSHDLGVVNEDAVATLNPKLGDYDGLLVGCGLGQEDATRSFMRRLLSRNHKRRPSALPGGFATSEAGPAPDDQPIAGVEISSPFGSIRRREQALAEIPPLPPTVIDADGLNNLAQLDDWHSLLPEACVLTPHPAEMARLCGLDGPQAVTAERWELARQQAAEWNAIVLLKGPYTVVAHPDGRLAVLPVATPALATAGTGDVLAGVITGLLAQGLAPFDAACVGAWLHGRAGEMCEQEIGPAGAVAGDLLPFLPGAMNELR